MIAKLLAKELKSLSLHFPEWDEVMRAYDKRLYDDDKEVVSDADVSNVGEVHKIFETILKVCTRCGRFKDTWDFPAKFSLMPYGQETVVTSRKMGATFTLGREYREIYLSSHILSASYIKTMSDEFWSCLVELS